LAFPNAYLSTDEPPGRSWTRSALALTAMLGVAYFGSVILVLSLGTTEYNPVAQFASDYGVGAYGPEMNSGFFLAGVGVAALALAILTSGWTRVQKIGAGCLIPAALALLLSGLFQTDIEGAPPTFHGAVHNMAGVVFFLVSPVGLLLISRGFGRLWLAATGAAFASGLLFVIANGAMGLDATGLAERIVILFVFASIILAAAKVYREA
jgi:hypothetical membrane protein